MNKVVQEALIYLVVAVSALFFMAYAVHMVLGGLVSTDTEYGIMAAVGVVGIAAMAYMAWDVIERRRAGGGDEDAQR
jgi:threonine/homoserine/homoserine lactone efflux protein